MLSLEYLKSNSIIRKFPSGRNDFINGCWNWIEGRRKDDNAQGLWRIHDKIYDLSDFVQKHPGGNSWIEISKGTDITEAFESYHLSSKPNSILKSYYVCDATGERNYRYTYHENGFYKTLRKKIAQKLKTVDKSKENKSKIIHDITLIGFLLSVVFVSTIKPNGYANVNYMVPVIISGLFLECLVSISHNFLHKKDNWRMYTGNLSLSTIRDMRIYHIFSHHMYPNTYADLETSFFDPYFKWIPTAVKDLSYKFHSILIHINVHVLYFINIYRMRMQGFFWSNEKILFWDELVMLITPGIIFCFNNQPTTEKDIFEISFKWVHIIAVAGIFHVIGFINRGHHMPILIHEGDEILSYDFGEYQLSTISDRPGANRNLVTILLLYGEQVLHQLFPSIDAAILPQLKDTLLDTCKEFDIKVKECSIFESVVGQYKQLYRTEVHIGNNNIQYQ